MSKFLKAATIVALFAAAPLAVGPAYAEGLGLGRLALPEEVAAWDKDIGTDGSGLPVGVGNALDGEEIFSAKCGACHGDFAEGVDNWPKLAGGADTLADEDPLKTVGSYWPYLSTTWDYINRSMPYGEAQTLTADEVYALVAYILYSNDLVDDDFELSDKTFAEFELPNKDGFIVDDRLATEHAKWVGEPCMKDCKAEVKVTMRARVLDVTPEEEGSDKPAKDASASEARATEAPATKAPATKAGAKVEVAQAEPAAAPVEEAAAIDPELIKAGAKVFKKCKACHQVGEGAKNRSGPILTGIVDHAAGVVEKYKYSKALKKQAEAGLIWDEANLDAFLTKPKSFMKGTKMSFAGLKKAKDRNAIIAYLRSVSE